MYVTISELTNFANCTGEVTLLFASFFSCSMLPSGLLLCSKLLDGRFGTSAHELCWHTDVTRNELLQTEQTILNTLNWRLRMHSPYDFISNLSIVGLMELGCEIERRVHTFVLLSAFGVFRPACCSQHDQRRVTSKRMFGVMSASTALLASIT